jgi:type IV pilus assembly protein PilX
MSTFKARQSGAALFIALIMLIMITLLAVSSMRGVTLESRITAHRAHDLQLRLAADAALREAEFRFYGPGYLEAKLEPSSEFCDLTNTLKTNGTNKPCLLGLISDAVTLQFVKQPQLLTNATKSTFLISDSQDGLAWMPYRGLDPKYNTTADSNYSVRWNSIRAVETGNNAINAEYGMTAEGIGTYFYLNNGIADDLLTLQSTHANVYLGLNN